MSKRNILRVLSCSVLICMLTSFLSCSAPDGVADSTGNDSTPETQNISDTVSSDTQTQDAFTADTTADTVPETSAAHIVEQAPIKDWDGAEVSVLMADNASGEDVFFDNNSYDEYSRLVKERNEAIEEKYGIKVSRESANDLCAYITKSNAANISPGIVYASGSGGMSDLMLYGELEDLYAYKDKTVTSAGVSVSVLRQLSVYDKLYMLTGAPIRSSVSSTTVTAYSKSVLSSLGYENGYLESLVRDGKWTYDLMNKLIKEYSGLGLSGSEDMLYSVWQGMGAHTVEKTSGDVPRVSVYTPRNIYYFGLVHELYDKIGETGTDTASMFCVDTIGNAKKKLNSDTAILPLPSYHEGGEYTCVQNYADTFFTAIPSGAENKTLALDYLRGLYSVSLDAVYEYTVEEFDFGNPDILDVILKSRHFDFLDMYGIGHIMKSAFSPNSETADFDKLLGQRAKFAEQALDIALRQTVGDNKKG